jgi:hypothetical protein
MVQTLYSFAAILIASLLMLTMNRTVHSNSYRMILTEVSAQVTPVAMDLLDFIGSLRFDPSLETDLVKTSPNRFADPITGSALCLSDPTTLRNCYDTMNELHGKRYTRVVKRDPANPDEIGITYHIDISFVYVDPDDFSRVSEVPTFHKRAELKITSPELLKSGSGQPMEIIIERHYSYPRVTG